VIRLESPPNSSADFDLETKACAEALQSVQKRTRIAFFLSLAASCIVILMVLNLWEARQFRSIELTFNTPEKTAYVKEYSQHVADNSFYQITALGIQITCEDVGILGPLALLVFSLYSAMAFKAYYRHVKCAAKQFDGSPLIRVLLETEQPLAKSEPLSDWSDKHLDNCVLCILHIFLFLPFIACVAVTFYDIFAHWRAPLSGDPLKEILSGNRFNVISLDVTGILFTLMVLACNWLTLKFTGKTKKVIE